MTASFGGVEDWCFLSLHLAAPQPRSWRAQMAKDKDCNPSGSPVFGMQRMLISAEYPMDLLLSAMFPDMDFEALEPKGLRVVEVIADKTNLKGVDDLSGCPHAPNFDDPGPEPHLSVRPCQSCSRRCQNQRHSLGFLHSTVKPEVSCSVVFGFCLESGSVRWHVEDPGELRNLKISPTTNGQQRFSLYSCAGQQSKFL